MLGLSAFLRARGTRTVCSYGNDPFDHPRWVSQLPGSDALVHPRQFPKTPAVLVTLDCASLDRLGQLAGVDVENFRLINEFLGYLADRAYSPQTVRAYAFDLLAIARWLLDQNVALEEITTDVLLRFLTACRAALLPGRRGDNVFSIMDGRNAGYAATTINRRLAAISALFAYRSMRHPDLPNPVPRGREARRTARGECSG